jgi:uncharacterized phage-associated protein
MTAFKFKKAVQSLNYFAILEGGKVNKMKALKLIWLADRLHLRKYGRTIINDVYKAMPNGPVASSTRNILERDIVISEEYSSTFLTADADHYFYRSIKEVEKDVFSKSDLECMEIVSKHYGRLDKFELSHLSHYYPEWSKFENDFRTKKGRSFDIDFADFFKNISKGSEIFNQTKEHLQLSFDLFKGQLI